MKRVNVNMHPKDGHFFKLADDAVVFGLSWTEVIARVVAYRKRNGLPPGNPEEEVHAQACQRNPNLCYDDTGVSQQAYERTEKRITVKGKVLKWFSDMVNRLRNHDIRYVEPAEVAKREAICGLCPKNIAYAEGCSSCKAAVKEFRSTLLVKRRVNASLNACSVLGEDTATSVHFDEHRVTNSDLPANCWRRVGS